MTSLRSSLDVLSALWVADRFDLYTVLEASPRFVNYPSTLAGLRSFVQAELPLALIRLHDESTVLIKTGSQWLSISYVSFLSLLFYPLYHCHWDIEAITLRDQVVSRTGSPTISSYVQSLLAPPGIRIEDVPDDWRDYVVTYISQGLIDLSKYDSISALERRVDQMLGLVENEQSPELIVNEVAEPKLRPEEKETLAKALRLSCDDFETKSQALELYARANR